MGVWLLSLWETNGASDGVFKGLFKRGSLTLARDHHIIYSFLGIALLLESRYAGVMHSGNESYIPSHWQVPLPPCLHSPRVSGSAPASVQGEWKLNVQYARTIPRVLRLSIRNKHHSGLAGSEHRLCFKIVMKIQIHYSHSFVASMGTR